MASDNVNQYNHFEEIICLNLIKLYIMCLRTWVSTPKTITKSHFRKMYRRHVDV